MVEPIFIAPSFARSARTNMSALSILERAELAPSCVDIEISAIFSDELPNPPTLLPAFAEIVV